jgi:hypothetical protein
VDDVVIRERQKLFAGRHPDARRCTGGRDTGMFTRRGGSKIEN